MEYKLLVGGLDSLGDFEEQLELRSGVELMFRAVLVDGEAVDVLEDEVGAAIGGDAAIEEARDAGVGEAGEDLALLAEALNRAGVKMPSWRTLRATFCWYSPSARSAR